VNEIPTSGWGAIGAGLMGAVAVFMHFRSKASSDATDRVEDRSKRDQIERLEAENNRLSERLEKIHQSPARRTEDVILIESLEAEQRLLMRDVKRLLKKMDPNEVYRLREEGDLESNFAALADVEERIEPRR
jgi:hypothetical protein